MTNVGAAGKSEASTDGKAERIGSVRPRAGERADVGVEELERVLQSAKQEWVARVKRYAEVAHRRGRRRQARRSAAEMDRALWEYKRAWCVLQDAYEGAGESATEAKTSLSTASFEQLRGIGMSVTQAKRVIHHRNQHGPFKEIDDLDAIPGFSARFLSHVKRALSP